MEKSSGESEAEKCSDQEQIAHRKCLCGTSSFKTVKWIYVTLFSLICNFVFIILFVMVFRELNKLNVRCKERTSLSSSNNALRLHFSTAPPLNSNGTDVSSNSTGKVNATIRPIGERTIVTLMNENELHTTGRLNRRSTDYSARPTKPSRKRKRMKNGKHRQRSGCHCRGERGPRGHKGDPGPRGPPGPKVKKRGHRGPPGPPGPPGPQGLHGSSGLPGQRGLQGIQGFQGLKGDRGLQGHPGHQGPKGDTGSKGHIGKRGPIGDKGDMGEKGDQGPRGRAGPKGEMGTLESNPRPAAHLTGSQSSTSIDNLKTDILRDWQDNMEYSITFAGMQHVNGQLVIPKQGRYFVYSHVYFNSLDDKSYLIHFVHHYPVNTTQDLVIMRSVATKCQDMKSKVFLFSSYQGGVFELKNGDRLAVGVSEGNSKSVSAADTASYFGAFMI